MLYQRGLANLAALLAGCVGSFLCAGCGNGEGHVAPVYAKWLLVFVFAVKHYDFGTFSLKMASGALGASGCPLGASWVLPGCLLGASGCSWVLPGCSWVHPGCLLAAAGCFLAAAGCLLGASVCS